MVRAPSRLKVAMSIGFEACRATVRSPLKRQGEHRRAPLDPIPFSSILGPGQAAQKFCRVEHDGEILEGAEEATNRTGVLGGNLRNTYDFFTWRGVSKAVTGDR